MKLREFGKPVIALLNDNEWQVQSAAVNALALLRTQDAVRTALVKAGANVFRFDEDEAYHELNDELEEWGYNLFDEGPGETRLAQLQAQCEEQTARLKEIIQALDEGMAQFSQMVAAAGDQRANQVKNLVRA